MLKQLPRFMIILSMQHVQSLISCNAFAPIKKLVKTEVSLLPLHGKTKGAKQFQREAPSS